MSHPVYFQVSLKSPGNSPYNSIDLIVIWKNWALHAFVILMSDVFLIRNNITAKVCEIQNIFYYLAVRFLFAPLLKLMFLSCQHLL